MAKQARGAGQPIFDLSSVAVPQASPYNLTYGTPADPRSTGFAPAQTSLGIVRGTGSDWMGPLNPLAPIAPPDVAGRAFDLVPGYNLVQQPRSYEVVGFGLMRALADSYDVLRLVIETCKNQVARLAWTVRVTEDYAKKNKTVPAAKQAKIDAANLFFKSPDKRLIWRDWIRVLLEDLFVIDAPTLMKRLTRGGKLDRLDLIAGDTIKPVIDDWGRTPEPYMKDGQLVIPPAYQQCYSDDTEVLTKDGWKLFADVRKGELLATRNMATRKFEWQAASDVQVNDYIGHLINFESRFLDLLVTPDHRMVVDRLPRALGGHTHRKGYAVCSAADLAAAYTVCTRIPVSSSWVGKEIEPKTFTVPDQYADMEAIDAKVTALRKGGCSYSEIAQKTGVGAASAHRICTKYSKTPRKMVWKTPVVSMTGDQFAAFMGAYLSEGCVSKEGKKGGGLVISQMPYSKGFGPYKKLLDEIFPDGAKYAAPNFQISNSALADYVRQFGLQKVRYIPQEIMDATPHQLEIFWNFYRLGDGDAGSKIFTSSRRMADQLQEVAQKIGWTAGVRTRAAYVSEGIVEGNVVRMINHDVGYTVSARKRTAARVTDITKRRYTGKVYCASVPNGTLYVRRNGKPAWCGNCLKGFPAVNYTKDQLIYKPYNRRSNRVYGYSQVEMVIITVNIALRREMFLLDYYREGNVPEAIFGAPDGWDVNQIVMFQNWWDATLAGNLGARRRARFVPSGTGKNALWAKDPSTDNGNKLDEWLGRIICYAFNQSPQWLAQQMNRATADTAKESSSEEGIEPIKNWVVDLCNGVIQDPVSPFADPDIEFAFVEEEDTDPQVQDEILVNDLKAAGITLNQFREAKGQDPYDDPAADLPMVYTATGYVPFDINVPGSDSQMARQKFQLDQQSKQMDLQNQYEPDTEGGGSQGADGGGDYGDDGDSSSAADKMGAGELAKIGWTDEAREAAAEAKHAQLLSRESTKDIKVGRRTKSVPVTAYAVSFEKEGKPHITTWTTSRGEAENWHSQIQTHGWSTSARPGAVDLSDADRARLKINVEKLTKDAGPKTLYVRRRLLNARNIIDWAKQQGFKTTLPEDDMHVTVVYSKSPVAWNAMPQPDPNPLVVPGDHTREVKPLGDKGAVVLRFYSSKLQDRWQQHQDSGASWDFPSYQPHVTISWDAQGMEHDSIEPYDGPLVFGPEVREEIDPDWQEKLVEKVVGASGPVLASRQGPGGRPPHTPPRILNGARSPASIDDEVAKRVRTIMKKLTEAACRGYSARGSVGNGMPAGAGHGPLE